MITNKMVLLYQHDKIYMILIIQPIYRRIHLKILGGNNDCYHKNRPNNYHHTMHL